MRLLNTAIIRLTLFVLAGIFTGFGFSPPLLLVYVLVAGALLIFGVALLRAQRLLLQDGLFGLSCGLLFFLLGFGSVQLHRPQDQPAHYSQLANRGKGFLLLRLSENLDSTAFGGRFVAEVKQLNGQSTHGKILLLLPKGHKGYRTDDLVVVGAAPEPVPRPLNPQQFDYGRFMENRGVLFQVSPSEKEIRLLEHREGTYAGAIEKIHWQIAGKLQRYRFNREELSMVQALFLGYRKAISAETQENFIDAGVVHLLAVSGLHVGLLLLILNFLLSPLDGSSGGKVLKTLLLLLLLWGYALLAGLSPSVVRAVSMFSFLAVGMQLRRQTNAPNTLFLSLLLLVLLRPQWLLEVGFQLSYLAVLSILLLQPELESLLRVRNRLLKYFWSLFTVTLAAQLGVLPLSLFYFHQFPGLFFLSNLLILPFLGLLMGLGLLVLCLALLNMLPAFLANSLKSAIGLLNELVARVAAQEDLIFRDIPFDGTQLMAFSCLLLLFFLFGRNLFRERIRLLLWALILLQGSFLYGLVRNRSEELVIFHKYRQTAIAEKRNWQLQLHHDLPQPLEEQAFLKNYRLDNRIRSLQAGGVKNVYGQGDGLLLLIDSTAIYRVPGLRPKRVLLTGSPKINLERLLTELRPDVLIADGSNYSGHVKRWRETCRKFGVQFHYTGREGAYTTRSRGAINLTGLQDLLGFTSE